MALSTSTTRSSFLRAHRPLCDWCQWHSLHMLWRYTNLSYLLVTLQLTVNPKPKLTVTLFLTLGHRY